MTNYTTGHCANHSKPGGCQLHNLQCGWPNCDRRHTDTVIASGGDSASLGREVWMFYFTDDAHTPFAYVCHGRGGLEQGVIAWLGEDAIADSGERMAPAIVEALIDTGEFHAEDGACYAKPISAAALNEPFGNPEQFDVDEPSGNSRQLASLEQRARELCDVCNGSGDGGSPDGDCAQCRGIGIVTAALANQQGVGGWQPIETAPQGTMILLADMTAKEARHWSFVGWKHHWNKAGHVETPSALNRRATHWKHLPEPPTQPAGDVGSQS